MAKRPTLLARWRQSAFWNGSGADGMIAGMTMRLPTIARPMLLTIGLAAALSACASVPPQVRNDGFARLHEPTRAGPLVVRPETVVEDSRCPMNARCAWAGRVVVDAAVKDGDQWRTRRLVLGDPALTTNGALTLDSVEPTTRTDMPIRAGDYRLHFSWRE